MLKELQTAAPQIINPRVRCPHCEKSFSAGELTSRGLRRSKWGISISACPHCDGHLKIDPAEYIFVTRQLRAGKLPEGVGIVAFKASELTPSEKNTRRRQIPFCWFGHTGNDWTRLEVYRLAARKFRYGVYLTLEIVWGMLAIYVSAWNYYFSSGGAPWIVLALLVMLSLAHSMTMTLLQPWHLFHGGPSRFWPPVFLTIATAQG